MKTLQLLLGFTLCLFCACNSTKKNAAGSPGDPKPGLVGTYWKLTELNGKPVGDAEEGKRREMYLTLTTKENRVSGNAGCNGFGGTYTLDPNGYNLKFSQMMHTQMACEGLSLENEYLAVLEKTDSYTITNNSLQLNRARMAPLAKFMAIPEKAPKDK